MSRVWSLPFPPSGSPGTIRGGARGNLAEWLGILVSFELFFALFLYSNSYKLMFNFKPPVDETLVFAALSALLAIPLLLREGIYYRGLIVVVAFVLFAGWAAMSLGWTPSRTLAPAILRNLVTVIFWSVTGAALFLANDRARCLRFLLWVLALASFLAASGLAIYIIHGDFKSYMNLEEQTRAYNKWGYSVSTGTLIAFVFALHARLGSFRQFLFLSLFVICVSFLFVGGSRGALLSTLTGCMACVFFMRSRITRQRFELPIAKLVSAAMAIGLVGFLVYAMVAGLDLQTVNRLEALISKSSNPDLILTRNRFFYYEKALEIIPLSPLVGQGLGGYNIYVSAREAVGSHPHNILLEIAANLGLIGLALFFFMLWAAMRHATLERLRTDPLLLCILCVFVTRFAAAMVSTQLIKHDILFAFVGLLCLRPKSSAASSDQQRLATVVHRTGALFRRPLVAWYRGGRW